MPIQNIFDSHAHYNDGRFDADREALFVSLPQQGVRRILHMGCDYATSLLSLEYQKAHPDLFFPAVGLHPEDIPETGWEQELERIAALAQKPEVVCVGEIGLDYYWDASRKELQKQVFAAQLELANRLGKPVSVHCREATGDCMELLAQYKPKGALHCFSGSAETAKEVVKLGMYLGFTGVLTFPNSKKARAAVEAVPMDRLLLETDAPYMAPVPCRGRRCDSSMIAHTAAVMAEIKGVSTQEMVDRCTQNAYAMLGMSPE